MPPKVHVTTFSTMKDAGSGKWTLGAVRPGTMTVLLGDEPDRGHASRCIWPSAHEQCKTRQVLRATVSRVLVAIAEYTTRQSETGLGTNENPFPSSAEKDLDLIGTEPQQIDHRDILGLHRPPSDQSCKGA